MDKKGIELDIKLDPDFELYLNTKAKLIKKHLKKAKKIKKEVLDFLKTKKLAEKGSLKSRMTITVNKK